MVHATSLSASGMSRGARRMLLGMALAVGSAVALSAWAQPGGSGPRGAGGFGFDGPGLFTGHAGPGGHGVDRLLDGLNATDAQRTQVKQIVQAAAADLKQQRDAARGLREQGLSARTSWRCPAGFRPQKLGRTAP